MRTSKGQANTGIPDAIAELNRTIHEPARLAILTVLSASVETDFTFLKTATGLSSGNLSVQLSRLEEASLITIERTLEKKRTLTMVAMTESGRTELNGYWLQMERLRDHGKPRAAELSQSRQRRRSQGLLA